MAPIHRGLAAALLALAWAEEDLVAGEQALVDDEACDAADPSCAMHLMQLRASRTAAEEASHEDLDVEAGLEGGSWLDRASNLADSLHHKTKIMTGYHQTSPEICNMILKDGFRPGSVGWCGGGIYFALSEEATYLKAVGVDSHLGCMLKVKVDVGKAMTRLGKYCKPDLTPQELKKWGYDSIIFNPGDGKEIVVYDPARILKIEKLWSNDGSKAKSLAEAEVERTKEALVAHRGASVEAAAEAETSLDTTVSAKKQIMTGYHQTSPEICEKILAEGFRPGKVGWCGGGIYFAMSEQATYTKAVGVDSHLGCMLKVKVDIGKAMTSMGRYCKPDLTVQELKGWGFDSIVFNPGDGQEMVIFDPARILKIEKVWSKTPAEVAAERHPESSGADMR